ncbi:MAG: ABC transporter permease [Desulfococcaceae bacterium]
MMLYLSQIRSLSLNVWREAVRDRLVHLLAGSGIFLMIFSLVLGRMAVGGGDRVLQSSGFWIMGIWGLLAVLYLGSGIIRNEISRKTVYLILSRPVSRPVFLAGKFIGMLMVLFSAFVILASAWLILMNMAGIKTGWLHFGALLFIFGEWILMAAVSLCFASFTSPLLHNFFLTGISFLGHWSNDLRIYSENVNDVIFRYILKGLYYLLPNLEALNFREAVLYAQPLDVSVMTAGAGVLLCWMLVFLISANLIFVNRKLI